MSTGDVYKRVGTFGRGYVYGSETESARGTILPGSMVVYSANGFMNFDENGITLTSSTMAGVRDGAIQWQMTADGKWKDSGLARISPSLCPYCHSAGGEDKYHPGTCANCGGIL